MPLRLAYYLSDVLLPVAYISSVRDVLLCGNEVMVVRDFEEYHHVAPGGRREAGETLRATLRREVLEETGWTLRNPRLLGFVHFYHLAPTGWICFPLIAAHAPRRLNPSIFYERWPRLLVCPCV